MCVSNKTSLASREEDMERGELDFSKRRGVGGPHWDDRERQSSLIHGSLKLEPRAEKPRVAFLPHQQWHLPIPAKWEAEAGEDRPQLLNIYSLEARFYFLAEECLLRKSTARDHLNRLCASLSLF